jgi:tRNA G18 (ribose-2'-O)-methylase SpoU
MSAQGQIAPAPVQISKKSNTRKRKIHQESNTGPQKRQTGTDYPNDARIKDEQKFESPKNVTLWLKTLPVNYIKLYSTNTRLNFCVMLLSVHGKINTAAIMRTSQLLGASKYVIFGRRQYDTRSACGAMHYMDVERVAGLKDSIAVRNDLTQLEEMICPDKFYKYMIDNTLVPVFLEQRHDAVYSDNIKWNSRERKLQQGWSFCFVFGNEGKGISNDVVVKGLTIPGSFVICIRQLGALKSFNVSASASIILSQYKEHKMKNRLDRYGLITG